MHSSEMSHEKRFKYQHRQQHADALTRIQFIHVHCSEGDNEYQLCLRRYNNHAFGLTVNHAFGFGSLAALPMPRAREGDTVDGIKFANKKEG